MGLTNKERLDYMKNLESTKSQETTLKVRRTKHLKEPAHDPENCETCMKINIERVRLLAQDATYGGIIARLDTSST